MRERVIEVVADVAERLRGLQPSVPPVSWDELVERFRAVDGPAEAELLDRLPRGEWVVDAVDGAVQFLQGLPQWCVSVALLRDGEPVLSVLHSPWLGETYAAEKGVGAWRDGVPVVPSRKTDPTAAVVATSHPHVRQPGANAVAGLRLPGVLDRVAAVRNLGPTSWQVADVAGGRLDAFWQFGRDAENLLGATLVATEAGAVVTTASGGPWHAGADSVVVAAPGLHEVVVETLR
ncbi:hypothetical protein GCM10010492_43370 [Saccharothrix mutabilis subsp. mutabilis]|uniref:Myo-inositol-1(Or 4)-monophosphatase n=1 Tax=Saccharothrix mutabilis subsp. mutabilis TaxID=66855 RepID=A0ABN0U5J8_9PSEU